MYGQSMIIANTSVRELLSAAETSNQSSIILINLKKSRTMSDKEVEEYIKRLDKGLALAEQEMLQDKASRNETIVYSDGHGNIKRALASDVLAKISKD